MFIEDNSHQFPVSTLCHVLEVKRGSYYAWRSRPESQRSKENKVLTEEIKTVHEQSRGTYGSPRIHAVLNKKGNVCGLNRIARIMCKEQIKATKRKKYVMTMGSKHHLPISKTI